MGKYFFALLTLARHGLWKLLGFHSPFTWHHSSEDRFYTLDILT
jgi:hypothetical protein